jgi:cytochrome P450
MTYLHVKSSQEADTTYCRRCGCQNMVAFTHYGDQSRRQRRMLQRALGAAAVKQYHELIELSTRDFLSETVKNPDDYAAHARRFVSSQQQ